MKHLIEEFEQFQTKVFLPMYTIARHKSARSWTKRIEWLTKEISSFLSKSEKDLLRRDRISQEKRIKLDALGPWRFADMVACH